LIFSVQRPLLCIPDRAHLEDTCANCLLWANDPLIEERGIGAEPMALKTCLRCKQVKYCSKVRVSELPQKLSCLPHIG
jgi:hypothetical protein